MAYSTDHLKKVGAEGFNMIDELLGRQTAGKAHRSRNHQDLYHQNQKLQPNQYVYHGPQPITVIQQADTGNYHETQRAESYARWHVYRVPQPATGPSINSNDAAAYYNGKLLNGDFGKSKQKQWA